MKLRSLKQTLKASMVLALLIVAAPWAMAQQKSDANVLGHVVDGKTGEHIPFVNIAVKGTPMGTTTDETGHYFLSNMPVGEQTLVFSSVGYDKVEKKIKTVKNQNIEINITLMPSAQMLESVVISANRYETKQREAATMVNVVSPVIFETTTSNTMADVLDYQTGLRVENSCQNCGAPQLRINGLEGQYSQILMDNRPMFSSLASVYGLEQIPSGMVDQIEVIRGGGSALFGSNAIGGVVNIVTKDPSRNFLNLSNTTSLLGGDAFDINTSLNASVVSKDSRMGAILFAVQRNRDPYNRNGDAYSELPKLNGTTVGFRSFFKINDYSKLTAEYHHVSEYRRGGDSIDLPPHQATIAEELKHNIDAATMKYDWFSSNNRHFLSIYTSAQHIDRKSYFGVDRDPNAYGRSSDVTSVTGAQYRFSWMVNSWIPADLSGGIEYTYNNLNDCIVGYKRDLHQKTNVFGAYLQNEWHNEDLSFVVGGRLEKHSMIDKPIFSPRANIRYTLAKDYIFRLSYASGYRAPQAYDEDLHVDAVGGAVSLIELDEDLRPEYSNSFSASIDAYKTFGDWNLNLTAEGFFTKLNHVFVLEDHGVNEDGNTILLRTNSSGAHVAGANIEFKVDFRRMLALQLGMTFQQSRYEEAIQWSDDPNVAAEKNMLRTPNNYGYGILTYEPIPRLKFALSSTYTGKMLVPHYAGYIEQDVLKETERFWDMGIKVAYEIPLYSFYTLEVNAGVKNIFDSFQKDLDLTSARDAGYIYGPKLPRTVFVGVNLKL